MKITMPYVYHIEARREKGRARSRATMAFHHAEVVEASLVETDMVAEWKMSSTLSGEITIGCLRFQGQLYIPTPNGLGNTLITRDNLVLDPGGVPRFYQGFVSKAKLDALSYGSPETSRAQTPTTPEQLAEIDVMQRVADSLLIAEGLVWQRISVPHLALGRHGDLGPHHGATVDLDYRKGNLDGWKHDISGGRLPDYLRLSLNDLDEALGTMPQFTSSVCGLDIFDPEAFRLDGMAEYAARNLAVVIRATEHDIGNWPRAMVDLWLAIRDFATGHHASGSTMDARPALKALELARSTDFAWATPELSDFMVRFKGGLDIYEARNLAAALRSAA